MTKHGAAAAGRIQEDSESGPRREIPFIDALSTRLLRSFLPFDQGRRPLVTKTELVEAVARDLNMTRVDAQRAVESVFGQIAGGLTRDGKVQIQGFGTFQTKHRKAREF